MVLHQAEPYLDLTQRPADEQFNVGRMEEDVLLKLRFGHLERLGLFDKSDSSVLEDLMLALLDTPLAFCLLLSFSSL